MSFLTCHECSQVFVLGKMFTFYIYIYGFLLCEGNLIKNVCRTGVSGWRLYLHYVLKVLCDVIVNRHCTYRTGCFCSYAWLSSKTFFLNFNMLLFGSNMTVFLLHRNCMRRFNSQLDAISQSGLHLYWTFRKNGTCLTDPRKHFCCIFEVC